MQTKSLLRYARWTWLIALALDFAYSYTYLHTHTFIAYTHHLHHAKVKKREEMFVLTCNAIARFKLIISITITLTPYSMRTRTPCHHSHSTCFASPVLHIFVNYMTHSILFCYVINLMIISHVSVFDTSEEEGSCGQGQISDTNTRMHHGILTYLHIWCWKYEEYDV